MRNIYVKLFGALALMSALSSCAVEEPSSGVQADSQVFAPVSEDVVPGELFVRFDERVSKVLEEAGVVTKSGHTSMTRSGLLSVDQILDMVDGYQIERVFPVDVRTEEKARRNGLHLWYRVRFSEEYAVNDVAAKLSALGEVSRVSYNRTLKRSGGKSVALSSADINALAGETGFYNDPLLKYQWHLINNGASQQYPGSRQDGSQAGFLVGADVNVKSAWEKCKGHPSIIVAVLDEGIDFNHPDLKASMWVNEKEIWRSNEDNDGNGYAGDYYGYNFAAGNGIISTGGRYDTGHGCHVAGVIAAVNDNDEGISSIAGGTQTEPGVKLMSCQLFSGSLGGTLLDEVRAIKYAADNGAVILQCSWGYISGAANPYDWSPQYATDEQWLMYNELEKKALDYFVHNAGSPDGVIEGGIAVFAAGNESAPAASYPAAYSDYISVAAIAPDYTPAVYTNYGTGTTISAPGGDQDYFYAYGEGFNAGQAGCVLSTLPFHVTGTTDAEFSGYGYMEGTSMACPHVSGVVALGLSYAAHLKKHFKASEIKEMLYDSSKPFESMWSMMDGFPSKNYYKYVASQQKVHYTSINLDDFKGKMGHGLVDAARFLDAIENGGVSMVFPNVFIKICDCEAEADAKVGHQKLYDISAYMDMPAGNNAFKCTVKDSSVATAVVNGSEVVFKGLKAGQTTASMTNGNDVHDFVITVSASATGNGWM